jgi:hypothetical protein
MYGGWSARDWTDASLFLRLLRFETALHCTRLWLANSAMRKEKLFLPEPSIGAHSTCYVDKAADDWVRLHCLLA